MEVKKAERPVITKPVASKPSCSSFRSFSELLAGAINASPSPGVTRSEYAVAAIRPKTVRAKPMANRASTAMLSSQGDASGTAPSALADKVLYKPLAKVVSKATVSLLASMGSPNITHQQALAQVEARAQQVNPSYPHATNQPIANPPPNIASQQVEKAQQIEPPKRASKTVEEEPKPYAVAANVDRPSYDGYNWRKYGQKQVKGSEYPRSYYKCTHPNCPVKKKVERSFDGQIAEIVYKGEHNHPKPQPPKRSSSGPQEQGLANDGMGRDQEANIPNRSNHNNSEPNEALEGRIQNRGEGIGLPAQLTYQNKSQLLLPYDHADCDGRSADCEEGSKGLGADDEAPRSKRRRTGNSNNEVGNSGAAIQEPQISVQSAPETEIVGDGFRWRKYGQKVVKGNPYPRSYYKCTSLECNVRKYVERASEDPRAFITTYEGKHNHNMPTKVTNTAASQPHSQAPTAKKS